MARQNLNRLSLTEGESNWVRMVTMVIVELKEMVSEVWCLQVKCAKSTEEHEQTALQWNCCEHLPWIVCPTFNEKDEEESREAHTSSCASIVIPKGFLWYDAESWIICIRNKSCVVTSTHFRFVIWAVSFLWTWHFTTHGFVSHEQFRLGDASFHSCFSWSTICDISWVIHPRRVCCLDMNCHNQSSSTTQGVTNQLVVYRLLYQLCFNVHSCFLDVPSNTLVVILSPPELNKNWFVHGQAAMGNMSFN